MNTILIADSGSTKTTWSLIGSDRSVESCTTGGINPFFADSEEIARLLENEFLLSRKGISALWFYGAGCVPEKKKMMFGVMSKFFDTHNIEINNDLLAAAHSLCGRAAGIACIVGTGSNSCLYDGNEIVQNVSPLGFILGDEGGGTYIGRRLLSDILKNQLPEEIRDAFFSAYPQTVGEILENVYRKPFPNRYLAQYAKFAAAHIDRPEIEALVCDAFGEFFRRNVMQYAPAKSLSIHFTGSIAFYFKDTLIKTAASFGLTVGKITQEPMQGLIEYHTKE